MAVSEDAHRAKPYIHFPPCMERYLYRRRRYTPRRSNPAIQRTKPYIPLFGVVLFQSHRLRMSAGSTSVQVKTMHEFMTAMEPGGGPRWTRTRPLNLSCGFAFGAFQASQIHRLAPNALRPS